MKKLGKGLVAGLFAALALTALSGCQKEGPAERAGKELDNAVDNAGQRIEKTGEQIQDAAKENKK